jgi:Ca-activated chloride channel family protein
MKWLTLFLLASLLSIDPSKISKVNKLKSEAKQAYLAGDMKTAIEKYKFLVDSLKVNEEEVTMNLANAYFNMNDTANAVNRYQPLSVSRDSKINSWANQQMGVVANRQGKFDEALNYFKQAMKAEPNNEQARYNYEMVKKKLEEKKKQEQQNKDKNQDKKDDQKKDQNKDQKDQDKKDQNKDNKDQKDQKDKKDQQNKDKQDQQKKDQKDKQDQKSKEQKEKEQKEKEQQQREQEKKDQQNKDQKKPDPALSEKLKEMKISEEKAKMILEAMKNQEVQYLQQNRRKATKPKDRGKPDW